MGFEGRGRLLAVCLPFENEISTGVLSSLYLVYLSILFCSTLQMVFLRSSLVRLIHGGLLGLMVERRHSLASPQVCATSCTRNKKPCTLLSWLIFLFSAAYAEYVLMEPSQAYHSIMATVHEKIYLSKVRGVVSPEWAWQYM